MIICSCNVISDRDVRTAIAGADIELRTTYQVFGCLGCNAECGRCATSIRRVMLEANAGGEPGSDKSGV
jgi:bacterioferritin-associated ferredoxin